MEKFSKISMFMWLIILLLIFEYGNCYENLSKYIERVTLVMPTLDTSLCVKKYEDSTNVVVCFDIKNNIIGCPDGPPDPRVRFDNFNYFS
jgi:hypothetical protein